MRTRMKKKLFFVLGLLMAVAVQVWAEELLCQTVFNSSNNSGRISSYTNEWTNTTDGFTVAIVNANNNNNAWEYIKFGSKNDASVGSITTANPISAKIDPCAGVEYRESVPVGARYLYPGGGRNHHENEWRAGRLLPFGQYLPLFGADLRLVRIGFLLLANIVLRQDDAASQHAAEENP